MSNPITTYPFPRRALTKSLLLRSRTVLSREDQSLTVIDSGGTRTIQTDWPIDTQELSMNGQFLLVLGDDWRRGAVWDTHTGEKVIDLAGEEGRRQELKAGLAIIEATLFIFVALRNKSVRILTGEGTQHGWLGTTGLLWFHVQHVVQLGADWICITGYNDGESFDNIIAVRTVEALRDPMLLYVALVEKEHVTQWGHRIAVGPAGKDQAVVVRDPGEPDEEPDNPDEFFRGLEIWDLSSAKVLERINYAEEFDNDITIGADQGRVALATADYLRLVERNTGIITRHAGGAFDPYNFEIARIDGETITISKV